MKLTALIAIIVGVSVGCSGKPPNGSGAGSDTAITKSEQIQLNFEARKLTDTWFSELDLASAGIEPQRVPDKISLDFGWLAAVDVEHKVLFTQLVSTTSEMRSDIYYYLLSIDKDIVLVELRDPKARILPRGAYRKYSPETIKAYTNAGAIVATVAKKPFQF